MEKAPFSWMGCRITHLLRGLVLIASVMVCLAGVAHAASPELAADYDVSRFGKDVDWIGSRVRTVGTEGYEQTAKYIEQQIAELGNKVDFRRHDFDVLVPVTASATINLPGAGDVKVYPFWPAGVRLNATPVEGIKGRLVYSADAKIEQIKPKDINGRIAVVESTAGGNWQQAAYFGAKAIVVLGQPGLNNADLRTHDTVIPFNLPRVFVPDGELANRLRKGEITGEVTLRVAANWERKKAHNYYVVINAANPVEQISKLVGKLNTDDLKQREQAEADLLSIGSGIVPTLKQLRGGQPPEFQKRIDSLIQRLEIPNPADMLSVPYDAGSLVPDLAYSASQAVQTAAGLALMREFAEHPVRRPVVIFFSGADSIQTLGTRQMFMALSDVPGMWAEEIETVTTDQNRAKSDLEKIRGLLANPESLSVNSNRDTLRRIVDIIETDMVLDQDKLFRIRIHGTTETTEEMRQQEKSIMARQEMLNKLRYAFTRKLSDLKQSPLDQEGRDLINRTIVRLSGDGAKTVGLIQEYQNRLDDLKTRIELYRWLAGATGRPADPEIRNNNSRVIEMIIALDLSDEGVRFGPMYRGNLREASNISQIQDYRDWFNRLHDDADKAKPEAKWFLSLSSIFDMEPLSGSQAPQSWLQAPMAIGTELCQFWGVPGFSLVTLDDLRLKRDTPRDTVAELHLPIIETQLAAVTTLLKHAWDDPRFKGPVELKWQRTKYTGQVVSSSPWSPVPNLPREGFVGMWYYMWNNNKVPNVRWMPYAMNVRRTELLPTDAEGNWRLEALPRSSEWQWKQVFVSVYRMVPQTGQIDGLTDIGRQTAGISNVFDVEAENDPMRNLVFNAEECTLIGLIDPRFLQDLGEVIPLDARRNAEPQRYHTMVQRQIMAGFFEPESRLFELFRYGRVGNRLLLLNTGKTVEEAMKRADEEIPATGFTVPQLNNLGPLSLVTSRDFFNLDNIRLEKYRNAGVSSQLIDDLHKQAGRMLDDAVTATDANDGPLMTRHANGAWANEARVYQATQDMANDVIRAAIFLLLLCVPFSFCMERLVIGTPSIYKQIAWTAAIFFVMAAALWTFHPAFKISSSPLIIILAFAIIFMSIVVISVVYGKFDTELKRIRSGRGSAATTSFARASVLTSAVLLGIANMRRRKFRTALTSTTIVLITFAVLCFTSATRYLDTVTLPTGVEPSHPGIMFRQRGWRPMPENVLTNLRAVLGDKQLIVRRWNVNAGDPKDQLHLTAMDVGGAPVTYSAQAALGLSPGEARLSDIAQVIGEEKFARLEKGEQNIVYFSQIIAEQLKVKEGDTIKVGGIDLQVAGIFDAASFDRRVSTLSGEPLAPLKYVSGMLDAGGRGMSDNALESLDMDADSTAAELGGNYEHLSATQFIIVPENISKVLPNGSLRSVAIRLNLDARDMAMLSDSALAEMAQREEVPENIRVNRKALVDYLANLASSGKLRDRHACEDIIVKSVSDELSKRFAIAIFAGFSEGVKMVAASSLASVSGAGQVAIPLAIAGMIIFNTMMGSIAERRREIHVYTSLGLAPVHVGALFLAEAVTYGLIGAVFGYVIGQGMGTLMTHLGWLGGVTLNYSGTSAMTTLGIILLVVVFSALIPARLASKIAAPSIDRTWRVPAPKDDRIIAGLPFTINKTAADGALAYLAEYFDAHQEGSIGKFSAGKVEAFFFADEVGRKSRGLKTVIWLTPFDLGVRQHLMLLIHPGQFEDIYEVQVVLQRLSGDDGSWYRMNRSFLTELRKQFLQWRSLTPQRMVEYVQQSQALFAATPDEVVTVVPGESVRLG